jgi:effector-binding domain-containing protein
MIQNKLYVMKILKVLGIILAVVVVLIIILAIALPTKYNVERSITIDAPKNIIFEQVSHFKHFIKWNPWSKMDPNLSYEITGTDGTVGAVYSWSGNDSVGIGSLTNISVTEDRIDQKLDFTAPWEAHDDNYYIFEDSPEGVKVTWGMDGNLDRPMNIMGLFMNMEEMIGSEYEKGLESLKIQVNEYMSNHTKRGYFINEIKLEPRNYIIKRDKVKFDDMHRFYATHFPAIMQMVQMLELPLAGAPSGLYYEWDMEKNLADMAAGIPVTAEADIEGYDMVKLGGKALHIEYYGPYAGVGNAHYAIDEYMQENDLILNELVIEEYFTDPGAEPDTAKWLTNIYYLIQ